MILATSTSIIGIKKKAVKIAKTSETIEATKIAEAIETAKAFEIVRADNDSEEIEDSENPRSNLA